MKVPPQGVGGGGPRKKKKKPCRSQPQQQPQQQQQPNSLGRKTSSKPINLSALLTFSVSHRTTNLLNILVKKCCFAVAL